MNSDFTKSPTGQLPTAFLVLKYNLNHIRNCIHSIWDRAKEEKEGEEEEQPRQGNAGIIGKSLYFREKSEGNGRKT